MLVALFSLHDIEIGLDRHAGVGGVTAGVFPVLVVRGPFAAFLLRLENPKRHRAGGVWFLLRACLKSYLPDRFCHVPAANASGLLGVGTATPRRPSAFSPGT